MTQSNDRPNDVTRSQGDRARSLDGLRNSLAELIHPVDVASVRSKVGEMTAEIRELRAWETDIVYDAYAFDLGTGD